MATIKSLPTHKRPREKLLENGPENLSNKELLAILIRTGSKGKSAIDIAQKILRKHKINNLLSITLKDLQQLKGIGKTKACTILAAFELSKRANKNFSQTLPIIESPRDAVDQLSKLRNYKKEHFVALYLNARNQLIYQETISIGTLNASLVHPREVFKPAIEHHAVYIILAHNHPSQDNAPSQQDKNITTKLMKSAKILEIHIKDHLIITKNDYFSFKQHSIL